MITGTSFFKSMKNVQDIFSQSGEKKSTVFNKNVNRLNITNVLRKLMMFLQTPWHCCWQTALGHGCSSPPWESELHGAGEADTDSRSTGPSLSGIYTPRSQPGCSDSPYSKICRPMRRTNYPHISGLTSLPLF